MVFNRKLLETVGGGFRSEFDGSQDYDLTLRLTEKAKKTHCQYSFISTSKRKKEKIFQNFGKRSLATITA